MHLNIQKANHIWSDLTRTEIVLKYAYRDSYGTWYAQFTIPNSGGNRLKKKLSKSTTEAQIMLNRLLQQFGVGHIPISHSTGANIHTAFRVYCDSHIGENDTRHNEYIKKIIGEFIKQVNVDNIEEIRFSHAQVYLNSLKGRLISSTIHKYKIALKHFFNFCKKMEWINSNPFSDIDLEKIQISAPYHFNKYEIESIKNDDSEYVHWWRFLLETGMRACDAKFLRREHFNIQDGRMYMSFSSKKTNIRLDVPISTEAQQIVERSHDMLFRQMYKVKENKSHYDPFQTASLKRLRLILNYRKTDGKVRHHTFRHTFAITHLNNGMPKEVLQSFLGHGSVMTTEMYYANWIHKTHLIRWI